MTVYVLKIAFTVSSVIPYLAESTNNFASQIHKAKREFLSLTISKLICKLTVIRLKNGEALSTFGIRYFSHWPVA